MHQHPGSQGVLMSLWAEEMMIFNSFGVSFWSALAGSTIVALGARYRTGLLNPWVFVGNPS